jgi:hypothetical protein
VAHNVLLIDEREFQRSDGEIEDWESNAGFDYVRATHPDYAPLSHHRSVTFVKGEYFLLSDLVRGEGEHRYDLLFHFEPTRLGLDRKTRAIATRYPSGSNLLLLPADGESLSVEELEGHVYSNRTAAPYVKYTARKQAPAAFDFVLFPYRGEAPPALRVRRIAVREAGSAAAPEQASALSLSQADKRDSFYLSHEPAKLRGFGSFQTDAQLAWVRTDRRGRPARFFLKGGSRLQMGRQVLVLSERPVAGISVSYGRGEVEVSAPEGKAEGRVVLFAPGARRVRVNGVETKFARAGDSISFGAEKAHE